MADKELCPYCHRTKGHCEEIGGPGDSEYLCPGPPPVYVQSLIVQSEERDLDLWRHFPEKWGGERP